MVSIIVPVYQTEKYVGRCIESLVNQSYQDLEIVLIDDGSTDNSAAICRQWEAKDKRIRFFHHNNRGVSYTRNRGIEKSKGEYLLFLDSDDILCPDTVRNMVDFLEKYKADICICGYEVVSEEGIKYFTPNIQGNIDQNVFRNHYFWDFYNTHILHNIGTKMYKKAYIDSNNIRFKNSYAIYEDIIFCLEYLAVIHEIAVLNETCYIYMKDNENSVTRLYRKEFLDNAFQLNQILYDMIQEKTDQFYYNILKNIFLPYMNVYMGDVLKWGDIKKITRRVCNDTYVLEANHKIGRYNMPRDEKVFCHILLKKNYILLYIFGCWKRIRRRGIRMYAKKGIQQIY